MARNIYYAIKAGGSTTHFHTLGAAKKAAKRIAKQSGRPVDIEKMSHTEYHRTGRASKGIIATVQNAGPRSIRKTKKRSPYSKRTGKAFKGFHKASTIAAQSKKKYAGTRFAANPLPIGRMVTVRAYRRKDGKIDLYG